MNRQSLPASYLCVTSDAGAPPKLAPAATASKTEAGRASPPPPTQQRPGPAPEVPRSNPTRKGPTEPSVWLVLPPVPPRRRVRVPARKVARAAGGKISWLLMRARAGCKKAQGVAAAANPLLNEGLATAATTQPIDESISQKTKRHSISKPQSKTNVLSKSKA